MIFLSNNVSGRRLAAPPSPASLVLHSRSRAPTRLLPRVLRPHPGLGGRGEHWLTPLSSLEGAALRLGTALNHGCALPCLQPDERWRVGGSSG
jgi:hypothetical protein